jgi:ribosome maturation factor RimP
MAESATLRAVQALVTPIVTDLKLDLYDLEFRGGTLRVTLDTPPGSDGGVDLDTLALATRLISRELDHHDPVPGHYTLEVTSPGLERTLRTPAHFARELGKTVALRLRDIGVGGERRVHGVLIAATDTDVSIRVDDSLDEKVVPYDHIDRAKTVFVWGPQPKPGGKHAAGQKATQNKKHRAEQPATRTELG